MDKNITQLTLNMLPIGEKGNVCSLPEKPELRRRLMALGLVEGTGITAVNAAPSGDPRAYYFRGALIALRQSDASEIRLSPD